MRRRQRCILDGLLAAIQNGARLHEQCGHLQWRLALDDLAIVHIGFPRGSKRDRQILTSEDTFGFD